MFVLWSVYTVLTFLYFEEPERIGIAEQEAMELAAARANEPKQTVVNPSRLLTSPGIDVERKLELADDKLEVESYDEDEDYAAALHDAPMTSKEDENVANSIISCFKAMTPAVYICMFLELVSKFSLEMLSSATSILTKNRYGWAVDEVGTLGSINGLMVIPVSIFVGFISQYYEDRALIMKLLIISLVGCLCLVDFSDFISLEGEHYNESHWLSVGPSHYVTGNLIFFSAIHAVESVNIALFSKVVPLSMAKGTFNCGLLATVVGTVSLLQRKNNCFALFVYNLSHSFNTGRARPPPLWLSSLAGLLVTCSSWRWASSHCET